MNPVKYTPCLGAVFGIFWTRYECFLSPERIQGQVFFLLFGGQLYVLDNDFGSFPLLQLVPGKFFCSQTPMLKLSLVKILNYCETGLNVSHL